jgi:U3 small nucleolar RNA-associated protein 13
MSSEPLQPKAVYEPVTKLEAFYTGGAVRVTRDHKHLACACRDEVKVGFLGFLAACRLQRLLYKT